MKGSSCRRLNGSSVLRVRCMHGYCYPEFLLAGCQVSYIFLYLEDSPKYSYIWNTVLYIPVFQCKQEMLNSYLKQMLLISNMERCKFVILQHLLSNSHFLTTTSLLDKENNF